MINCIASNALMSIVFAAISAPVLASEYPADYCHQVAEVATDGPAFFAYVGSGCLSTNVFGYKLLGPLAESDPDKLDLIAVGRCVLSEGSTVRKESVITLGREWHGRGYLSAPVTVSGLSPEACFWGGSATHIAYEFAFSDGASRWDSKNGANFVLRSPYLESASARLQTHEDDVPAAAVCRTKPSIG